MTDLPVLRLRPKSKPQAIRHGFPWVFADESVLDRRSRAIPPGGFAVLEDAERKHLGLVTVNPNSKIVGRVMDPDPEAVIDTDVFIENGLVHAARAMDAAVQLVAAGGRSRQLASR